MIARLKRAARGDEGASAVEFALVVVPLLVIVFGIISFGLYFAGALGLSNATREAARYGVVQNRTCENVITTLRDSSSGTLGIVYPINFQASRAGSPPVTCSGSISEKGVITYSSDKATVLCKGSKTGADELTITSNAGANLFIPTLTFDLSLTGKGTYRCEFS